MPATDAGSAAPRGAAGRFALAGLPAGSQLREVVRVGSQPVQRPDTLRSRDSVEIVVTLPRATLLRAIGTTGRVAPPRSAS